MEVVLMELFRSNGGTLEISCCQVFYDNFITLED